MATETVQAKYRIPEHQRAWVVAYAKAQGCTASEIIDMLIQNWRRTEAGLVKWSVVESPPPEAVPATGD